MYFSLVWSRRYEDHRVLQSEGQVLSGESGGSGLARSRGKEERAWTCRVGKVDGSLNLYLLSWTAPREDTFIYRVHDHCIWHDTHQMSTEATIQRLSTFFCED